MGGELAITQSCLVDIADVADVRGVADIDIIN